MIKRRKTEVPPSPSKLDRLSPEDVYGVLETALSSATKRVDDYRRCDAQQKEAVLAFLSADLHTAALACASLQRRMMVQRL